LIGEKYENINKIEDQRYFEDIAEDKGEKIIELKSIINQ